MIKFSVQGALFVLKEETIMRHDWLLSKVVTSQIPWEAAADGQIFLDIDPSSFRLILSILGGVMSLANDARNLAPTDLVLLKCTARYLMLDSLDKQINETLTGFEGILKQKDETIAELNREKAQLEQENTTLDKIAQHLAALEVQQLSCQVHKTRHPYNACGCTAIVIGNVSISKGISEDIIICGKCNYNRSRLYGRERQFDTLSSGRCTVDDLEKFMCRSVVERRY
jgi:hypothetical protein